MFEDIIKTFEKGYAYSIANGNGIIQFVNDEFVAISGFSKNELIGNTYKLIRNSATPAFIYKQMWDNLTSGKEWTGILKNIKKDGSAFIVKIKITPFNNIKTKSIYYVAKIEDISSVVFDLEKLYHNNTHSLTGMHGRETLAYNIQHRETDLFQLAIIDVDNFKGINDFYGYQNGDILIKKLSIIIENHLDTTQFSLYHISIDEFILIGYTNGSESDKLEFKQKCMELIQNIDEHAIKLNDYLDVNVSLSIGMSFGDDMWQVLREADIALYEAKHTNKQMIDFTRNSDLNKHLSKKMYWIDELKYALAHDKIIPWLQPIQDNKTEKIVKFEALVRLVDRNDSIISPFHFLDIAKATKSYNKVSYKMIYNTLTHFINNLDHFNINLSWQDLSHFKTIDMIKGFLDKYEHLGPRMTIELVEEEGVENFDTFQQFIDSVKPYGVKIALDDFGSGYSNFIYLDRIQANFVKIDGTLIKDMMENERTLFIVESIVAIAKKFGIETVAEFVSSKEIYEKVKELGIDYSQGYYIGKPRPIDW